MKGRNDVFTIFCEFPWIQTICRRIVSLTCIPWVEWNRFYIDFVFPIQTNVLPNERMIIRLVEKTLTASEWTGNWHHSVWIEIQDATHPLILELRELENIKDRHYTLFILPFNSFGSVSWILRISSTHTYCAYLFLRTISLILSWLYPFRIAIQHALRTDMRSNVD